MREVHLVVRLDPETERKLDQIGEALRTLTHKVNHLSQQSDALNAKVDALQAASDATQGSLTEIRQDIADIKSGLPTSGGLTADEVTALSGRLDALSTKVAGVAADAAELASENPTPPPPPPAA